MRSSRAGATGAPAPAPAGPQPGERAPGFALESDTGEIVSLEALRGRIVVLFFYPEDNTPGCTAQACEFRDDFATIAAAGAALFGLSPDTAASHAEFRADHRLPFPLLVDRNHQVADAYGVWGEKRLFGVRYQGIKRTTFVIDAEGVVRLRLERAQGKGHARAVTAWLRDPSSGRTG